MSQETSFLSINVEDNPGLTFFPGQTVSGNIGILKNLFSEAKGISITFTGIAQLANSTTEEIDDTFHNNNVVDLRNDNYSEEEFYTKTLDLKKSEDSDMCPFKFTLPQHISPTFVGKCGLVVHFMKAQFTDSVGRNYFTKRDFKVNGILDLNTIPQAMEMIEHKESIVVSRSCFKTRRIKYKLHVSKKGFAVGEHVDFKCRISNRSSHSITCSYLRLVQNCVFFGTHPKASQQSVGSVEGPSVPPGQRITWENNSMDFQIPNLTSTTLGCHYINDVSYSLRVEFALSSTSLELRGCEIPIFIGTGPLVPVNEKLRKTLMNASLDHPGEDNQAFELTDIE